MVNKKGRNSEVVVVGRWHLASMKKGRGWVIGRSYLVCVTCSAGSVVCRYYRYLCWHHQSGFYLCKQQ